MSPRMSDLFSVPTERLEHIASGRPQNGPTMQECIDMATELFRFRRASIAAVEAEGWQHRAQSILDGYDKASAEPMVALANFGDLALTLLRAMLAAAPKPAATDGWQTMDSAPRDGATVLVFDSFAPGKDGFAQVIARHDKEHGWHVSASVVGGIYIKLTNPTHWRHLPAAPEVG